MQPGPLPIRAHSCASVMPRPALRPLPRAMMLFEANRAGCRIAEVPITFVERREGESKVSRAVLMESAITPWRLASGSRAAAPSRTA